MKIMEKVFSVRFRELIRKKNLEISKVKHLALI